MEHNDNTKKREAINCMEQHFRWLVYNTSPDRDGKRKLKVLLLADNKHIAKVVSDHISAFPKHSCHSYTCINPIHDSVLPTQELYQFDAIIVHYSIYILGDYFLSADWLKALTSFSGVKVQIIQDEHRNINRMRLRMNEIGFHAVVSSLSPSNASRVYSCYALRNTCFFSALPGYISDSIRNLKSWAISERPLDIVYRGRILPPHLGKLALLKSRIGDQMLAAAVKYNLAVDIASAEDQRIYGDEWLRFLMRGRATLGVEGGASIFDFDGKFAETTEEYCAKHPEAPREQVWKNCFSKYEGNIIHKTLTPKLFEAIAAKTALILYPGEYRGVLQPDKHYIELDPSGENIPTVIDKLRNTAFLQELVDTTHKDIMQRSELHFDYYVKAIDALLDSFVSSVAYD